MADTNQNVSQMLDNDVTPGTVEAGNTNKVQDKLSINNERIRVQFKASTLMFGYFTIH